MILLAVDEIIAIHSKLIRSTGGIDGIRDRGLLESATFSIYSGFDDVEQYPTVEEKAARLGFSLINNHAFIDGNKRIGILALLMTLKLNSIAISYTQNELIKLGLAVAEGKCKYEDIHSWILKHLDTISPCNSHPNVL